MAAGNSVAQLGHMAKRTRHPAPASQTFTPAAVEERHEEPTWSEPRSDEEIASRAYEIYQARGGEHGKALDDWLQAEAELRHRSEQHESREE